ncbi:hypothetical protein ALC56_04039 [Trachymyrmex septentrionalis]|uniref:Uncharacterized protein n=1 Tax=Trachymyrmex septentrionalis TaxID=34720 RepID=A0A151JYN0_9HYME|nr:hypothetical protein ALC56_04039 [Trachymyrmex septentrionalis]
MESAGRKNCNTINLIIKTKLLSSKLLLKQFLNGTDPTTFELVKKVQILQERILKMSTDIIHKERKLNDTEKLYMNLRNVLSKNQPNSQRETNLDKVQNILRKRGEKIKVSSNNETYKKGLISR